MVISGYEIEGKMTDWSKYLSLGKEIGFLSRSFAASKSPSLALMMDGDRSPLPLKYAPRSLRVVVFETGWRILSPYFSWPSNADAQWRASIWLLG